MSSTKEHEDMSTTNAELGERAKEHAIDDAVREELRERERLRLYGPKSRRDLYLYQAPRLPWQWQLFRKQEITPAPKLAPRVYKPRVVPPDYLSTPQKRLEMALAKDNGGMWWVARTEQYGVVALERMFAEGAAPGLLYEAIGGILGSNELTEEGYLYVQILDDDPAIPLDLVRVTLEDLRVYLYQQVGKHVILDVPAHIL
jgi:hypothetical protein